MNRLATIPRPAPPQPGRATVHALVLVLAAWLVQVPARAQELAVQLVAQNLVAPIQLEPLPGAGPGAAPRMLVVQQDGVVRVLQADGSVAAEPFLDLRPRMLPVAQDFEERGLLGLALHPGFARNGRFFVTYSAPLRASAPQNWNYTRRVAEFTAKPSTAVAAGEGAGEGAGAGGGSGWATVDLASERVLIELDWPSRKHNGGALAFGPDGYLYIGFGDSGASHGIGKTVLFEAFNVPAELLLWDRLAQDLDSLFGKVLRIDIDHGFPGYAIPVDNPFVGARRGRPEIWAWGFRNPYRIAFDGNGSGEFFITATAETLWEAAYRVRGPGNFGWPLMEGAHCVDRLRPRHPPASCPEKDAGGRALEWPVVEYANMQVAHADSRHLQLQGVGTAITAARMVRSPRHPRLKDKLLFADWSASFRQPSGQLFVATPPAPSTQPRALWPFERVLQLESRIIGLAEDGAGELYVLTHEALGPYGNSGKIYKLVAR